MISWLEKHGYVKSAASLKEDQKRTIDYTDYNHLSDQLFYTSSE